MEYKIIRSKRKTISIRVKPDLSVEIRAPYSAGKNVIEEILKKHSAWVEKSIERQRSNPPVAYNPTKEEIQKLKAKTREIVLPLVEKYESIMDVAHTKISFTSAKRVFGSCTAKRHLNFSFRLALYPNKAIEYVVVHELCHMKEMNHSKRFWAEVEKILPDYKARRELLKEKI